MPPGVSVSGLESDGGDQFFCGGGNSGRCGPSAGPSEAKRRAAAASASRIISRRNISDRKASNLVP